SRRARMPRWYGSPAVAHTASFTHIGTPRKGPSGSGPTASRRASSKRRWITALQMPSSASMRAMAASTSSSAVHSRRPRGAANAVASAVRASGPTESPMGTDQARVDGRLPGSVAALVAVGSHPADGVLGLLAGLLGVALHLVGAALALEAAVAG